jgi:hypothetical protein
MYFGVVGSVYVGIPAPLPWNAYAKARNEEKPSFPSRVKLASMASRMRGAFHGARSAVFSASWAMVRRKYCWRLIRPRSEVPSICHFPSMYDS